MDFNFQHVATAKRIGLEDVKEWKEKLDLYPCVKPAAFPSVNAKL